MIPLEDDTNESMIINNPKDKNKTYTSDQILCLTHPPHKSTTLIAPIIVIMNYNNQSKSPHIKTQENKNLKTFLNIGNIELKIENSSQWFLLISVNGQICINDAFRTVNAYAGAIDLSKINQITIKNENHPHNDSVLINGDEVYHRRKTWTVTFFKEPKETIKKERKISEKTPLLS